MSIKMRVQVFGTSGRQNSQRDMIAAVCLAFRSSVEWRGGNGSLILAAFFGGEAAAVDTSEALSIIIP